MTLTQFLLEEQRMCLSASGSFTSLFSDLVVAAKIISRDVNRAGLIDITGGIGSRNVHGEDVQKLDVLANTAIVRTMERAGHLAGMASEESEGIIAVDGSCRGHYLLLFDPLDGSSNIDVNISVGTIFSILKCSTGHDVTEKDFLRPGSEQVCAGYILYGSSTMFVYTTGHGVHGFTLDPGVGEFLLSHENIRMPDQGKIYSINRGQLEILASGHERIHQKSKEHGGPSTARYVGSLVGLSQEPLKGGVFLYPADKKAKNGKLRLMYEGKPSGIRC